MDASTLNKRLKQLENFCACKNKCLYICICSDDDIHCLCELVFNVLEANIFLKKKVLYILKELRSELHCLADSCVNISSKRRVLNYIGKILFPIIRKYILPSLKKQLKQVESRGSSSSSS